jgi:hypothetical protein
MEPMIDYAAVLADLKARRDALDKVISHLEVIVDLGAITNYNVFAKQATQEIHGDTFVGLNIPEATAKYLGMVGRPARTTTEITEALNKGGISSNQATVATVLGRGHNAGEDVVRAGKGLWGLAAWYPTRPKSTKKRGDEDATETSST